MASNSDDNDQNSGVQLAAKLETHGKRLDAFSQNVETFIEAFSREANGQTLAAEQFTTEISQLKIVNEEALTYARSTYQTSQSIKSLQQELADKISEHNAELSTVKEELTRVNNENTALRSCRSASFSHLVGMTCIWLKRKTSLLARTFKECSEAKIQTSDHEKTIVATSSEARLSALAVQEATLEEARCAGWQVVEKNFQLSAQLQRSQSDLVVVE